ncbi:polysaccharide export protein [Novosphingobium sp. YJ-S2-02]|uniref:Polysaccharide export protein n=1 Tax=Novosphingobium aureum TaxID=2792964 RepID=A0A931HD04_9SPHN|nr:polysaccharide biosynthesis/export family protein [Novosphingobium aureum]MBH0113701.1 polysaccharide export protein [Novosphingobium aureum]
MTLTSHPVQFPRSRTGNASGTSHQRRIRGAASGLVLTIGAACAMLTGCSSPTASLPTLASTQSSPYRVDAGDQIHVAIQDLETVEGDYTVEDGGAISLPYLKSVKVAGLGYREIEQTIATSLVERGILTGDPVVNVRPAQLRPFYVTGEVNQPGEFQFREGMTVLAALSAAGGYTYRAKTNVVAITRTTDGQDVTAQADESTIIKPGDRIRVYERWF